MGHPFSLGFRSCCAALAGFVAATCAGQSSDALPAPTGTHAVGRTSFAWRDAAREELETKKTGDQRELMVHLFHPADPASRAERAVYMPDADVMRGPINDALMARVQVMRAHARDGAALPPGDARFPVLLCAPGGGMKGLTYHALCEDLASHGWVVAAIDPPYNARGVLFPDGRVLGNLPTDERTWPPSRDPTTEQRAYRERIAHWCDDLRFVVDQLAALDAGDGPFARRLDLARGVGVFGHSRGGQAAGSARLVDERVRGAINFDGAGGPYMFQPLKGEGDSGAAPFVWVHRPFPPPPSDERLQRMGRTRAEFDAELARVTGEWGKRLGAVTGGALRVVFDRPGIEHIDFSDEPLWDDTLSAETRAAKLATLADARALLRAFFAGTVRGEWAEWHAWLRDDGHPGITVHSFGRIGPPSGPPKKG